jgi:hypothetical protein
MSTTWSSSAARAGEHAWATGTMITWGDIRTRAQGPQVIIPSAIRRACHQRGCAVKAARISLCRIEDATGSVVWDGPLLTTAHNGTPIMLPFDATDSGLADALDDLERTISSLHHRDALLASDWPAF